MIAKPVRYRVGRGQTKNLPIRYIDGFIWFATDTGKMYIDAPINGTLERTLLNPDPDWSVVVNKPDIPKVYYNTVAGWAASEHEVSEAGAIYIYSDANQENGVSVPSFKIGDGNAYIIDLPSVNQLEVDHINDTSIHVTPEEKEFWNNKVRTYYSQVTDDTLIFTTD